MQLCEFLQQEQFSVKPPTTQETLRAGTRAREETEILEQDWGKRLSVTQGRAMDLASRLRSLRARYFTARHALRWLAGGVAFSTGIKLWLALTTVGSNDVYYWSLFQDWLMTHGPISIYRDFTFSGVRIYNHPPLLSAYLMAIHPMVHTAPNGFSFLIRLPAILADCFTPFVIYLILHREGANARPAFVPSMAVALSPILMQISGFHGNTDPVFVLLLCLSLYSLLQRRAIAIAGFFLGLSINIKIVPILFVPLFFFAIRTWSSRARFGLAAGSVVLAGFGYNFLHDFEGIRQNVFGYGSNTGIWGITKFLRRWNGQWLASALKLFMLATTWWASWWIFRKFKTDQMHSENWNTLVLRSMGAFALLFFVLTPGFGVQYLAWIAILGAFVSPVFSVVANLCGGLFLFCVYTFWCGGLPWNFANSDKMGPWKGWISWFDTAIWIYFCSQLRSAWHEVNGNRQTNAF